jgi:peptidoglycan/LPS O-acetylase OafA/YrhL
MGGLRLILAITVLLSHLEYRWFGLNLGVTAVIIFYILSGHVAAMLWGKWRGMSGGALMFYRDRALRILPQYFIAVGLGGLAWALGAHSYFLNDDPGMQDWLYQLLIIPLNYFMYIGREHFMLVPPAWSLGAEIQFLIFVPLLYSLKLKELLFVGAVSVFVYFLAQLQVINPEYYGYRLLPGVLFIFLLGGLIEWSHQAKVRIMLSTFWLGLLFYTLYTKIVDHHIAYNQEVLLGLLFGIPLITFLRSPKIHQWLARRPVMHGLDRGLGSLSYGVFLYHFPVIWMLGLNPGNGIAIADVTTILALTLFLAWMGHVLLERGVWKCFRRRV